MVGARDYEKALAYPYPHERDIKWRRMYDADSVRFVPYYPQIAALYRKYRRECRDTVLEKWVIGRIAFNDFLNDNNLHIASFEKLEDDLKASKLDIEDISKDFSRDDVLAFINILCDGRMSYSKKYTIIAARLVYAEHIKRHNLINRDILEIFEKYIKHALNDIFRFKNINETDVKLLAYVWEALGNNETAAANYDWLINGKHKKLENPARS